MTKYLKKLLALVIAAGAMTAMAEVPEPVAMWNGNFSQLSKDGFTISGGAVASDASTIGSSSADGAILVTADAPEGTFDTSIFGNKAATIIVEYANYEYSSNIPLLGVALHQSDGTYMAGVSGVAANAVKGVWQQPSTYGMARNGTSRQNAELTGATYRKLSVAYANAGTSDYVLGTTAYVDEIKVYQEDGLRGNNLIPFGFAIGGLYNYTGPNPAGVAELTVRAIAIFNTKLTDAQIAEFEFPAPPAEDSSTPVLLVNVYDTSHSEVTGWLNHTQTKDSTDSPKIPKNGDYLGTADGVHFSTSSGGNFFNNHTTANTDFETGTYVDIFGGEHETLAEEVATSLGLPEGTVFNADVYKSGVMNGGVHGHTATIANLDNTKTYVVYIGTGLLKSDNTGSNSGIGISASSFASVRSIDYVITVDGAGGTKQPNYQSIDVGSAVTPGKNGVLVMRLVDVVPNQDGTITFTLGGDRAGLNFLAVSEVTRNTPTKLTATMSTSATWADLIWEADGKTYKWINGDSAEIEVQNAATLTLDPTADVKSIKFIGSAALTLTTADGSRPSDEFIAKLKLGDYTGEITYGWNIYPTVIALNFNATANDNGDSGGSNEHKLLDDERVDILGMYIRGEYWSQFTVRTQETAEHVSAVNTVTGENVGTASVTWRSNNVYMYRNSTDKVIRGYLDDGSPYAQVMFEGIPFSVYDVIVVCATDTDNRKFSPVTVNGTNYRWDSTTQTTVVTTETGAAAIWGQSRGAHVEYGRNALKIESLTSSTLTIVGGAPANNARGGIAAVLIVESKAVIPEITGDMTMTALGNLVKNQDDALVLVKADATITQDGTALTCQNLTLRADGYHTLSIALTDEQLAAAAAIEPNTSYDFITAIFGLKPVMDNVTIEVTNLPDGLKLLSIGGEPTIVKPAAEAIFTPSDASDWSGRTLPFFAKTIAAEGNKSFAGDAAYLQTLDSGDATVAVVTGAPEGSCLYGLHAINGAAGLGEITRDVYLKVTGGTPHLVSGGDDAGWDQTKTLPHGNLLVNLSGDVVADQVFGAGQRGGGGNNVDGHVGVVVEGNAQVKGAIAGGYSSVHNAVPAVAGNVTVLIKNVQTMKETVSAAGNYNLDGWIFGGCAYLGNMGGGRIGGNTAVVIDIPEGESGAFAKPIIGGSYKGNDSNAMQVEGNSSVTITAPNTVSFAELIVGGGHSTGATSSVGGDASVTLNGGVYTGTITAGGDHANATVAGTATITVKKGDVTGATFNAGTATGAKTLAFEGGTVLFDASRMTGFTKIAFKAGVDVSFPDGWGANTPVQFTCGTLDYNGTTSGEVRLENVDVKVGTKTFTGVTLVYDLTNKSVYYTAPKSGTLTRRPDFDGMTDADRYWTAPGSWIDSNGQSVDWPTGGAGFAVINADEVSSIIVDARINADMITLTNTAAQEANPSFKFLTKEPLDQVADMSKTNPEYVILGKLSASGFRGDLYLQSRITQSVALGNDTHVFFVAMEAGKETTAYPYQFSNMVNPICKIGPGAFVVPSSMYTYAFNVKGGSLIYDIAAGTEATVSGVLQKDTDPGEETHLLIKRGEGTMVYTQKDLVNFLDGVEIRKGTFKLGNTQGDYSFWDTTTPVPVTVKDGATLDMNGKGGFASNITLGEGATLVNSNGEIGTGSASLRSITLTGNATVNAGARFGLLAAGYGATSLNLGGHTLTKTGTAPFHLCRTSSDDTGTIDVQTGTIHCVHQEVSLPNVTVKLGTSATFDLGTTTTIGGLTLGPTYAFNGGSSLTITKALAYEGPEDSVFTWYAATLGADATISYPATSFTMKFPSIPAIPAAFTEGQGVKVELEVPNLSVGYVYPITGVVKENVTVMVNGAISTAAKVEVDSTSIKILPPLSRTNPVTGEEVGFVNVFTGATDANWATSSNWQKMTSSGYVEWTGTAPMLPNTAEGGFEPALIAGDLITEPSRHDVTLGSAMEGWNPRLGLFNGVTATVTALNKIQKDAPSYFMVDATSKLTIAAPSSSKSDAMDLYVAAEDGITWTSAFSAGNALGYHFAGNGSVKFMGGVTGGTHTIKRFDLTIGDATKEKGIVSKKLVSFTAASTKTFAVANDLVVVIADATTHQGVVPTRSPVDALSGNEALGTYYTVQTEDGVYVKYIGYSENPEPPSQVIIDQTTSLSAFFAEHTGVTGEILVVGKATCEEAFDVTFDTAIPAGVTFSVSGHVNFKVGGSVTALPTSTISTDAGSCLCVYAPFDAAYTVAADKTLIFANTTIAQNLTVEANANVKIRGEVAAASSATITINQNGVLTVEPSATLSAGKNNMFNNSGIHHIYGTLNLDTYNLEFNSFWSQCKYYFYAGSKIVGTGKFGQVGGYDPEIHILDYEGATDKFVTFDVVYEKLGAYANRTIFVFEGTETGLKFLKANNNNRMTLRAQNGAKINGLELVGADADLEASEGALIGDVKASGHTIEFKNNNVLGEGVNLILPSTFSAGATTQSFNGKMTVTEGSATIPDFITDEAVIVKLGAGELVMGSKRPPMNVVAGSVRVTAALEEIEAGKLVLRVTPDAVPGEENKVTVVSGSGSIIPIKSVVVNPEEHTVTITLASASINESKTMSEIKTLFPEGGAIAIFGSDECDDSVTITLDTAVPENYSFTVAKHVTFAVADPITTIPMSKISLNEGACVVLNAPVDVTALTIAENTTVKTRANQTLTLTSNGTFVVMEGAEVIGTGTDSDKQGIKGTLTIEKGGIFRNGLNDSISYGNSGTTVKVYGTLDMNETRWTVGGSSSVNLYGEAKILGVGDGEGVIDIYRDGNTINVYKGEGEEATTATIEGLIRSRNGDGNIWIQAGASLALPGGIQGAQVASPKLTRKGNGFFAGTIPLYGKLELDYGTQLSNLTEHFRVKDGEVTLRVTGKNGTADAICTNDTESDPFIEVASEATLNLNANNLSGSLGEIRETGWIVNRGTLVFMDGNGYRYFRDHLVLNGSTVKINSGDHPLYLYGGVGSGENAQIVARGDADSQIIVGTAGSGNGKIVLAQAEGAEPGAAVYVGGYGKLTISAPIEGASPFAKRGEGTLNIAYSRPLIAGVTGVLEVIPTDAELEANEIRLPTTLRTCSLANFAAISERGTEVGIRKVDVEEDEETGEKTIVITLKGNMYTTDTRVSEWPEDLTGTLIVANTAEDPITIYVDQQFPLKLTDLVIRGNVKIVVANEYSSYGDVKLFLNAGATVTVSGRAYPFPIAEGPGGLFFDPGEGKSWTITANHDNVTGPAGILSGTIKMGNQKCLGAWNYDRNVTVFEGATLDTYGQRGIDGLTYCIRLREGAVYTNTEQESGDIKFAFPVSKLILEGNAFIRAEEHRAGLSRHWNNETVIELNNYTLTKIGSNEAYFSRPTMTGTGTFEVLEGSVRMSHQNGGAQPSLNNGKMIIHEGTVVKMEHYVSGTTLSVKDLVNNGNYQSTNASSGGATISGTLSGTGRFSTPVTLGANASLKLTEEGSITFANTLTSQRSGGNIRVSTDGINTVKTTRLEILKADTEEHLPAQTLLVDYPARWLVKPLTGGELGYKLMKPYLAIAALTDSISTEHGQSLTDFEDGVVPNSWPRAEGVDLSVATESYTYDKTCGYPIKDIAHTKVLSLGDTSFERTLACPFGEDIESSGLYFDSMVKFTPGIDNEINLGNTVKFAVFTSQASATSAVKLCAKAGYFTNGLTTDAHIYDLTPSSFDATAWHRLTIKALPLARTDYGDYFGFVIFLDGEKLAYSGTACPAAVAEWSPLAQLDAVAAQYYDKAAAKNALLPCLFKGSGAETLSGFSFMGIGSVDDVVMTKTAPDFAAHHFRYSLTWDDGVETLSVGGTQIDLTAAQPLVKDLADVSETLDIQATFKSGFAADGWINGERAVSAGDTVAVKSYTEIFKVNDTVYRDTDEGRREAVRVAMLDKKPLVLTSDYSNRQIYIEYPKDATADQRELVLDLNGHTLGPINLGPTIYVNNGASLKVIDSTGAQPQVLAAQGMATIRSHGAVTIENGTYEAAFEAGSDTASFTFTKEGAKIVKGDEEYFPYELANGLDATEVTEEGVTYWLIGSASEATIKVPEVEHAVCTVTIDGVEQTRAPQYKAPFDKTVVLTWTPAEEGWGFVKDDEVVASVSQTIETSSSVTQPTVDAPTVDALQYAITYKYMAGETEVTPGAEDVNGNPVFRSRYSDEITIDPELISIAGYTVLGVTPETIAAHGYGEVEVIVSLEKNASEDWPEEPETVRGQRAIDVCPYVAGTELENVDAADLSTWAKTHQIDFATAGADILPNAFLLNCANNQNAIAEKAAQFSFTAADLATLMAGGELTTLNGITHNGQVIVLGSSDLKTWHRPKESTDNFWKAELTFKFVEVK